MHPIAAALSRRREFHHGVVLNSPHHSVIPGMVTLSIIQSEGVPIPWFEDDNLAFDNLDPAASEMREPGHLPAGERHVGFRHACRRRIDPPHGNDSVDAFGELETLRHRRQRTFTERSNRAVSDFACLGSAFEEVIGVSHTIGVGHDRGLRSRAIVPTASSTSQCRPPVRSI